MRKVAYLLILLLALLGAWTLIDQYSPVLLTKLHIPVVKKAPQNQQIQIVTEESVTINVVKKVSPSVVTIVAQNTAPQQTFDFGPFSFFGNSLQPNQEPTPQSIGSGFIVDASGLVVTNKHVVSDTNATYQVVTDNNKKYTVSKVYRDPLNDIAILKIDSNQNIGNSLTPVVMGDSSHLQVGSYVIAIGTALGEFRSTVTTGVISGLGRGITAGDEFAGYVEKLDNVIQTSAAISPGNSGGPLANSSGQIIGMNTAVAASGQNIGFALPVNVIKDSLNNFNQTGQFNRPYLGIAYKTISRAVALLNDVPEGAYVETVIHGSPADIAGVEVGDIVTKIDGIRLSGGTELTSVLQKKKIGERVALEIWRDSKTITLAIPLAAAPEQ
ncbi:MAG TPA: trypsin-like peptidase domain-containing protein [Candidatus Eisenbacteria bacterium]|nr:trypsin-like peptidase domain-containing protein [Candidatus Eisenbacteria bacterium]